MEIKNIKRANSKVIAIGCALLVAGTSLAFIPSEDILKASATSDYNYAKGLQYSMYLYDANMCGTEVGENSAMDWRDDCHTNDASATYNGTTVDVSGGYHDAGDHVKFGLPQAYSASILGWGYYEFKDAYTQTGQADHMKTISTYFADYFKKCTIMENGKVTAFCYQVGDGNTDHSEWCSPEDQDIDRPTYWATSSNPATDIVSNTAGALAFHYKNFGDTESLTYAKALYEFAKTNNKQCATDGVSGFYSSDSYLDDLAWAAAALYEVTGDSSYKSDMQSYISQSNYAYTSTWPLCWGNMWVAVNAINDDWSNVESVMTAFQNKTKADGVYNCQDNWGSARYNTAMQLVGLIYDKENGTNKYGEWAKSQMDYLMGDNPNNLCYITGFSSNSVTQPHHRAATGYSGFPSENEGVPYANTLIGALVGGPDQSGNYVDEVDEYTYTEVAIDYNAGFVGAMAGLYLLYGSGQTVDSSIVGVSGVSSSSTTTTTTTTTTAAVTTTEPSVTSVTSQGAVTTTASQSSSGSTLSSTTQVEYNSDGTDVLKIYINTGSSDTVSLTLTGGTPGATTSGLVGYWDNSSQSWVEGSDWSEQKFDSNGNLTITDLKVPTNTSDVQILLTYYADWSTGSENLLSKSSLGISVSEGTTSATTTVASTYSTTSAVTTTASQSSSGSTLSSTTQVEYNSDGTDVLKIYINTGSSDTVSLTLTGGTPGATTSGLVGYWDNSSQSWVEGSDWSEQKFDSNGNLTITDLKVPTNTNDVQILLTYYADWSTGSENLLSKSSLGVSVSDGTTSATTTTVASTYSTTSAVTTTASQSSSDSKLPSTTQVEYNSDGTDVLKIYINTGSSDTVSLTITGGTPGATTSGLIGYWDSSSQSWVEGSDWSEKKFDSNGTLTITDLEVPTNTDDVQILLTYYADWSTGSENLLDKSSLNVSVSDGTASTTTTTTPAVTTTPQASVTTTYSTTTSSNTTSGTNGDTNNDSTIDGRDLILLKKYVLGLVDTSSINITNADANQDGSVDGRDLILLKRYVLGIVASL